MELSKTDLLKLLSVLEGELQAREVVIAVLKAEQIKQLLYPKKRGGKGDPIAALQRDVFGVTDPNFDESEVKAVYNMQLQQLEQLILEQRKVQLHLRDQLLEENERAGKIVAELEDEKRKHAQDTAQGDDVTYMLEKERERLKQELEFEKQQNKKLEKELKKLTETLEKEQNRQKEIVLLLLAERKRLIVRLLEERQQLEELTEILNHEKAQIAEMVEGLEEESQKSLQLEAELEKQQAEFSQQKEHFQRQLSTAGEREQELISELEKLREEDIFLRRQLGGKGDELLPGGPIPVNLGEGVRSTIVTMVSTPPRSISTVSPTVSPPRNVARAVSPKPGLPPATPAKPPGLVPQIPHKLAVPIATSIPPKPNVPPSLTGAQSHPTPPLLAVPQPTVPCSSPKSPVKHFPHSTSPVPPHRPVSSAVPQEIIMGDSTTGHVSTAHSRSVTSAVAATSVFHTVERTVTMVTSQMHAAGADTVVQTQQGGNIPATTAESNLAAAVRKPVPVGRGTPPPVPPNKPVLPPQVLYRKEIGPRPPVPPRSDVITDGRTTQKMAVSGTRFGVTVTKNKVLTKGPGSGVDGPEVARVEGQVGGALKEDHCGAPTGREDTVNLNGSSGMDMIDQELADFQELLVSMVTGEKSSSCNIEGCASSSMSSHLCCVTAAKIKQKILASDNTDSLLISSHANQLKPSCDTLTQDPHHESYAATDEMYSKILENDNTAIHKATANGHLWCLNLILKGGFDINAMNEERQTPLHIAVTLGNKEIINHLLKNGADPMAYSKDNRTPLHEAVRHNKPDILWVLLQHIPVTSLQDSEMKTNVRNLSLSLIHLAFNNNLKGCLAVLLSATRILDEINLLKDSVQEMVKEVASLLEDEDIQHHKTCDVVLSIKHLDRVQLHPIGFHWTWKSNLVGTVVVNPSTTWNTLEQQLSVLINQYWSSLCKPLTLNISGSNRQSSKVKVAALGLSWEAIQGIAIGPIYWKKELHEICITPCQLVNLFATKNVVVYLKDETEGSLADLVGDTLLPVQALNFIVNLLESSCGIILSGPSYSGKTYLALRLAYYWAHKLQNLGEDVSLIFHDFGTERSDSAFKKLGKLNDFLVTRLNNFHCIVILDNLLVNSEGKNGIKNLEEMVSSILSAGKHKDVTEKKQLHFVVTSSCLSFTEEKEGFFKFVNLLDVKGSFCSIVDRHLRRQLIHHQFQVHASKISSGQQRAAVWVIAVWNQLNSFLAKVGLAELKFGPFLFTSCPLTGSQPTTVANWLLDLWNTVLFHEIEKAVVYLRQCPHKDVEEKVVNSALSVIARKVLLAKCPLAPSEKSEFIQSLLGIGSGPRLNSVRHGRFSGSIHDLSHGRRSPSVGKAHRRSHSADNRPQAANKKPEDITSNYDLSSTSNPNTSNQSLNWDDETHQEIPQHKEQEKSIQFIPCEREKHVDPNSDKPVKSAENQRPSRKSEGNESEMIS
ncbi:uncharacterized protein LOC143226422 [Tachypleus tridentatus]|uniref:uncharacterized protein LOC143226422 n=1 Tax=Tachypleus tridentatus TaxID=6853 RepID=UPI003FD2B1C5